VRRILATIGTLAEHVRAVVMPPDIDRQNACPQCRLGGSGAMAVITARPSKFQPTPSNPQQPLQLVKVAACMMARHFSMRDSGRQFSAHLDTITLAATLAPLLTGAVHQSSGGCDTVLTLYRAAFLSGVLLMLPLVRYPRFE
jgi:hypothetical protein